VTKLGEKKGGGTNQDILHLDKKKKERKEKKKRKIR
jgi:hypothetical protein